MSSAPKPTEAGPAAGPPVGEGAALAQQLVDAAVGVADGAGVASFQVPLQELGQTLPLAAVALLPDAPPPDQQQQQQPRLGTLPLPAPELEALTQMQHDPLAVLTQQLPPLQLPPGIAESLGLVTMPPPAPVPETATGGGGAGSEAGGTASAAAAAATAPVAAKKQQQQQAEGQEASQRSAAGAHSRAGGGRGRGRDDPSSSGPRKSRYRGVQWDKNGGKWRARIHTDKTRHIGASPQAAERRHGLPPRCCPHSCAHHFQVLPSACAASCCDLSALQPLSSHCTSVDTKKTLLWRAPSPPHQATTRPKRTRQRPGTWLRCATLATPLLPS